MYIRLVYGKEGDSFANCIYLFIYLFIQNIFTSHFFVTMQNEREEPSNAELSGKSNSYLTISPEGNKIKDDYTVDVQVSYSLPLLLIIYLMVLGFLFLFFSFCTVMDTFVQSTCYIWLIFFTVKNHIIECKIIHMLIVVQIL